MGLYIPLMWGDHRYGVTIWKCEPEELHAACISGRLAEYIIDAYEQKLRTTSTYYRWFLKNKHLVTNPYPRDRIQEIQAKVDPADKLHPYNIQDAYEAKMKAPRINDKRNWTPERIEDLMLLQFGQNLPGRLCGLVDQLDPKDYEL